MGVTTDFIRIDSGDSRINLKLRSIEGTEINGRGPDINADAVRQLMEKLDATDSGDILVLAGSIPSSIPDDIYKKILDRLSGRDIHTVVDATGDLLVNVLFHHPFLVKPNNHELGEIFGVKLRTRDGIVPYAEKLRKMGARNVQWRKECCRPAQEYRRCQSHPVFPSAGGPHQRLYPDHVR